MNGRYDPGRRHRRSLRLKGYDYAQAGAYFVTIVAQGRACLFGEVMHREMRLNQAGEKVRRFWTALPDRFPGIEIDAFVVMPNGTAVTAFDSLARPLYERIASDERESHALSVLRDALLPKLVSGEVRIEVGDMAQMQEN